MADPVDVQNLGRSIHEALILATLREGPKHGYQIGLDVEARTSGRFAFRHGTLYPILHRLEREGRIEGHWEHEGGRRRKRYALTRPGRRHLEGEATRIDGVLLALRGFLGAEA